MNCLARLAPFALVIAASAQTYTPKTILFEGANAYTQADLLRTSELKPGQPVDKPTIQAAMKHLDDTGLFASMHYNVDEKALKFTLVPLSRGQMLPALYDNFVVLDPDRITPLVHARVPLFTGRIPNNGTLQQQVQDALAAILLEQKGIHARIESLLNKEATTLNFSIADPPVQIRKLTVDGVSSALTARVDEARQSFVSSDYDLMSDQAIRQKLDSTYLNLGFLDIAVDPTTHGPATIEPKRILVDVSTTVHEGGQYMLKTFTWPESTLITHEDFDKAAQLKPGEPAARVLVLSTKAHVEGAFARKGYMDAHVDMDETKDTAAHTVGYTYTADPGEQYHLKAVNLAGATPKQQAEFDKNWKLSPGDPYDGEYVETFLYKKNLNTFNGYEWKTTTLADRATQTVKVTISLKKRP